MTAKLYYSDGTLVADSNSVISASQALTMDGSTWNKIASFFKDLFGVNRITER